jgi:hypothetical protein
MSPTPLLIRCRAVLGAVAIVVLTSTGGTGGRAGAAAAEAAAGFIDVHFHAHPQLRERGAVSFDTRGAAREALDVMDRHGIARAVLMPPPFEPERDAAYDYRELREIVAVRPDRFVFLGGGGTLNPMIHATAADAVTADLRARFEQTARAILAAGARGFGEMTALHFSLRPGHPFEQAPADHPLFLLLSDIAAERGVPIDLHMEAVATARPVPRRIAERGVGNPDQLGPNIDGLERLLARNRKTPVLWSHVGWDNAGQRRPRLMRRLLAAHPNLYMSFKLREPGGRQPAGGPRRSRGNPIAADGSVKPDWLVLLGEFPDRFVIGSDSHVYVSSQETRIGAGPVAAFLRRLPATLAGPLGRDNAKRLFRLD